MENKKVLHLTLKKKWFDMILSGEKKEEYREYKPYWNRRLWNGRYGAICFRNGYGNSVPEMMVELKRIEISLGIIEWGAPERQSVFILKLGKILSTKNIKPHGKD